MSRASPPAQVDFVAARWRSGTAGWCVLLLGLVLAIAVVRDAQIKQSAGDAVQRSRERMSRQADQRRIARLTAQRETVPEAELRKLATVSKALGRPWAQVFDALDAVADPEVALTRMEPDGNKGTLLLAGEARSLAELFAYAQRLAAQPGIAQAQVLGYSFREQGGARSIAFTLSARWGTS
jgi:Tfp pilus assembly protein PilN